MPVKNTIRTASPDTFHHIYNRSLRNVLFQDTSDYDHFIQLLERYLLPSNIQRNIDEGYMYPSYFDQVQLHSFCLMPTHFHFLLYQIEDGGIHKFMKSLITRYVRYFNKKYMFKGSLFESVYKSKQILNDHYLQHVVRYIHMNPINYTKYQHSSYQDYLSESKKRDWVMTNKVNELFSSKEQYLQFLQDYADYKRERQLIKYLMAD